MAKSAKPTRKKASPVKKAVKKTAAKKASNKSVKTTVSAKKSTSKKVAPKKAAFKKKTSSKKSLKKQVVSPVKKVASKKAAINKNASKKKVVAKTSQKSAATKPLVSNIKIKKQQKKVMPVADKDSMPESKALDQQTSRANDYTEMINSNSGRPGENNETITNDQEDEAVVNGEPNKITNAIPAPIEKYSRPADAFHGKTAPVKSKSNIAPSGKKPLWNK